MVVRAGVHVRLCRGHERVPGPLLKPHEYDAGTELARLLDRSGLRITFDSRRSARAAREWPDHLPPMFPALEIERERWVPHWVSPAAQALPWARPHWVCTPMQRRERQAHAE